MWNAVWWEGFSAHKWKRDGQSPLHSGPLGGGSQERCDLAGNEGICTSTAAQAPAMSNTGLAMIVIILIALGAFTLARRRQTD